MNTTGNGIPSRLSIEDLKGLNPLSGNGNIKSTKSTVTKILGSGLIKRGLTLQANGIESLVYDYMVDRRREIRTAKAVFSEVAGETPGG